MPYNGTDMILPYLCPSGMNDSIVINQPHLKRAFEAAHGRSAQVPNMGVYGT